ncbi:MAG: hypothetical protein FJY81_00240 [Candidatus Aminicenantes bacterium]|nr:hypothetical protein [Candidatus Aminicenantes bacterium]
MLMKYARLPVEKPVRPAPNPLARLASAFLLLSLLFLCACSPRLEYAAGITSRIKTIQSYEGEAAEVILRVKNVGKKEWASKGPTPFFLSFHLLDKNGKTLRFDNPRTPLPHAVRPGDSIKIGVKVKAPLEEGSYRLEFDLVREGLAWFKDYGSKTLIIPLRVALRIWPEDEEPLGLGSGKFTAFRSSVPELETLRKLIRLTLTHNETGFPGKTGKVSAFTAGGGYPQVWLRDAATILPASRYYYPQAFLSSWLEEHLAFQKEDGALEDWIDSQGRSDKNTVETDQEASAIHAAYQIFLLRGPDWLKKEISGEAIVDRLEKALLFVFDNRFDRKFGLVTGAHTADWGDVGIVYPDQRAIYVDENTHWTVDIYDQSMCYQACLELARMLTALGEKENASAWEARAESLKESTDRWLWQEDKGFYRVHLHLDSLKHDFDEDDMFAMGGNTQAILSGLAGGEKAARIIAQALKRQKQYNVSTISGSLLPPYPAGFFKHPVMDEPYEYQNGGQWDWFGGRLVYAMFENGFSRLAKEKLAEILRKNMANGGLYEWDSRDGAGRGSDYYAGSAGSLAKALFEGTFGLGFEGKSLILSPRLGEDEALVRFYLPAADIFIVYDYRLDPAQRKITFRCHSNFPYPGQVRILIPWEFFGVKDRAEGRQKLTVRSNGQPIPPEWLSLNQDDYIMAASDFRNHTLELYK